MKILDRIIKQLEELRAHPEPDLDVYSHAASLLREANEEAIYAGINPEPVRELATPANAIASAKRIINAQRPNVFMTVPEAAEALRVRHQTVTEWIKEGRIEAVNVGKKGSPAYRVPTHALLHLIPEKTKVRKLKYL